MIRRYRLLPIACLLLVLLGGCGHNATQGTSVPPTATAKPSTPAGSVTVHVDALSYRANDAISVTLSNQSNQTIQFPDHLTNCTIVLLQRQVNESWESVNLCRLMIVTWMHSLDAGHSFTVKLVAPPNQWMTGLYRASLSYRMSHDAGRPTAISSAVFQVG